MEENGKRTVKTLHWRRTIIQSDTVEPESDHWPVEGLFSFFHVNMPKQISILLVQHQFCLNNVFQKRLLWSRPDLPSRSIQNTLL